MLDKVKKALEVLGELEVELKKSEGKIQILKADLDNARMRKEAVDRDYEEHKKRVEILKKSDLEDSHHATDKAREMLHVADSKLIEADDKFRRAALAENQAVGVKAEADQKLREANVLNEKYEGLLEKVRSAGLVS